MIVEGYYDVKILTEPLSVISVKGTKMLCKNAFYDAAHGKWIIEGEQLLSEDDTNEKGKRDTSMTEMHKRSYDSCNNSSNQRKEVNSGRSLQTKNL